MAENRGIARPYAQAAFELARDAEQLQGWSEVLHVAADVAVEETVARLIDAPGTDSGKLIELISGICTDAVSSSFDGPRVVNMLRLLAENGRLDVLPEIAELFDKLKADVENSIDVTLTAAAQVDETQQRSIVEALQRRFGRKVNLNFKLDEQLIGGARLQADDLIIDGSVRTGLAKLASALTN